MANFATRLIRDESGATAIEYGLLAALLGAGIVFSLTGLTTALESLFAGVMNEIPE